ncbi:hypothetical protein GGR58DRAFT_248421 [Xylaria digitata]|nr:hypothetical protein GGR58DRAFT_248421 [Xylaria digitata]
MPLPPNLTRSFYERRNIDLAGSRSQASSTNALRTPLQRDTTVNGGGDPTCLRTGRSIATATSSTIWSTSHSPAVRTPYTYTNNPGFAGLQFSTPLGNTLNSEQGSMTEANEAGGCPQMTTNSSAAPNVVGSYQPQPILHNTSSLQFGRGYLSPILANSGQYVPIIGQRRDGSRGQPSPCLQPLIVVECGKPAIARIDEASNNSWVYSDALAKIIKGTGQERLMHPCPPQGRYTVTEAGYDYTGGPLAQLTLRIRDEEDIQLPLAIFSREQMGEKVDGMGVDMVLCRDFVERLVHSRSMTANGHRRMDNTPLSSLAPPGWQMTGRF